jgi:hypothetical protein
MDLAMDPIVFPSGNTLKVRLLAYSKHDKIERSFALSFSDHSNPSHDI